MPTEYGCGTTEPANPASHSAATTRPNVNTGVAKLENGTSRQGKINIIHKLTIFFKKMALTDIGYDKNPELILLCLSHKNISTLLWQKQGRKMFAYCHIYL